MLKKPKRQDADSNPASTQDSPEQKSSDSWMMKWIEEKDSPEKRLQGHQPQQRTIYGIAAPRETADYEERAVKDRAEANEMLWILNQDVNLIAQSSEEYVRLATQRDSDERPNEEVE